jgi:hypothetical protein
MPVNELGQPETQAGEDRGLRPNRQLHKIRSKLSERLRDAISRSNLLRWIDNGLGSEPTSAR